MITYKLLTGLFGIVEFVLSPLKNIELPTINISGAAEYIRLVGFFLPMKDVLTILAFLIALLSIRTIISTFKTVWDVLPFT